MHKLNYNNYIINITYAMLSDVCYDIIEMCAYNIECDSRLL